MCLCPVVCDQAETRAEFAERTVAKLEKTIDDLEGKNISLYWAAVSVIYVYTYDIWLSHNLSVTLSKAGEQ